MANCSKVPQRIQEEIWFLGEALWVKRILTSYLEKARKGSALARELEVDCDRFVRAALLRRFQQLRRANWEAIRGRLKRKTPIRKLLEDLFEPYVPSSVGLAVVRLFALGSPGGSNLGSLLMANIDSQEKECNSIGLPYCVWVMNMDGEQIRDVSVEYRSRLGMRDSRLITIA